MTNPGPGEPLPFGQTGSGDFNILAMQALHLPPRRKTLASRPGVQENNAMQFLPMDVERRCMLLGGVVRLDIGARASRPLFFG
jgi:hypothetical protein